MMKLTLKRIAKKDSYTIGNLYVNGQFLCNTIEDKDRNLKDSDSLDEIKNIKIPSLTAIPSGTYRITLNVVSPKFYQKDYYKKFCGGRLPRLLGVKGFDGILIHKGTTERDSAGCIIVGDNTVVGKVTNSQNRFEQLYKLLEEVNKKGEDIIITIE